MVLPTIEGKWNRTSATVKVIADGRVQVNYLIISFWLFWLFQDKISLSNSNGAHEF